MSLVLTAEQVAQLLEPLNYGFYTRIELYDIDCCYDLQSIITNFLDIFITIYFECERYKITDIDILIENKIQSLFNEAIIALLVIAQSIGLEYKFIKNKFQLASQIDDIVNILSITHSKKHVIEIDFFNAEYVYQIYQECTNIIKITVNELHKINAIYKMT